MPEDLRKKFDEKYHLDREAFLKKGYQGEQPSRFLAGFAMFAMENIENQYIVKLVGDCFEEFINSSLLNVGVFSTSLEMTMVGFVGSIAFVFQDIHLQVLENHNLKCLKILKNPMDGLVEYYKTL